ncbi:MFS transporter [Thalassospira sp. NFXS8]|uniref:MFS transporter n=1 Tax=Thalassospira sp. NFXS8 TaxID=2819093 RepID=UPI0032DF97FC
MTSLSGKQVFVALVLVNLASFAAQILQIGVMDTLIPLVLTRAGMDDGASGLVLSLYWLTVLVGGFATPGLVRRFHPFWLLLVSSVSSALVIGVLVMAPAGWFLMPLVMFAGLGLILRWTVCDGLIVQLAPQSGVGAAVGIHETLMGLGIALGPAAISWLGDQPVLMMGLAIIGAIIPAGCASVFPRLRMEITRRSDGAGGPHNGLQPSDAGESNTNSNITIARLVDKPETAFLMGGNSRGRFTFRGMIDAVQNHLARALVVAGHRWVGHWQLAVIAFVAGFLEVCFLAVLPLQAERSLGGAQAGLWLATVFAIGGTVCQPVLGHLADRVGGARLGLLCLGFLLTGAVLMGFGNATGATYDSFGVVIAFVIGMCVAGLYTVAVLLAAAGGTRGYDPAVLVLVAQSYTLGAIMGPAVGTSLLGATGNWALPGLSVVAVCVAMAVLAYGRNGRV